MKKLHWGASVMALLFCACSQTEIVEIEPQMKGVSFTASDFVIDEVSRTSIEITDQAAVFTWVATDTIGIFPDTDASQARFSMISGAGTKTATFDGGGWALKSESKYAAYYPYIPNVYLNKTSVPVDYKGQIQKSNTTRHLGDYDFMAASAVVPTDGEVSFNFKHLNSLVQLKLTLPKAAAYHSITLKSEQKLFPVQGKYDLMADEVKIVPTAYLDSLVLGLDEVATTVDGQEVIAYMMMAPADLSNHEIAVIARGADDLVAEGTLKMKNLVPGTAYSVASVLKVEESGDEPGGDVEDGVTVVDVAGTLESLLGDAKFDLAKLKIKGKLNSDDVALLRRMSGGYRDTTDTEFGVLKELDLLQAKFVPGGTYYLDDGKRKYRISSSDIVDNCMFFGCGTLENIVFPENITQLGEAVLSHCSNLKLVNIPESVKEIGVSALNGCSSLEEIQLPSGLLELGTDAFHSCTSLLRIVIPSGITSIGSNTFGHCYALKDVVLSDGLNSIGSAAFAACRELEKIVIPNSVEVMGERAFGSCTSLVDVTLSGGQTELGAYVFENCTSLKAIVIPEGMEVVASRAFSGCSNLKEFSLPSTLRTLKDRAFYSAALMSPIVVKCMAVTPPTVGTSVWKTGDFTSSSKLYVPASSVEAYKKSNWSDYFGVIESIE